jgi:hypothetical protein
VEDIALVLAELEGRLLRVIREGHGGRLRPEEANRALVATAREFHLAFHRIQERLEQRDLSLDQEARLVELRRRCLRLYRKARVEDFFVRKLRLEEALRQQVSPEAFEIYETLQAVEEEEEDFLAQDEAALERALAETTPVGEEADDRLTAGSAE